MTDVTELLKKLESLIAANPADFSDLNALHDAFPTLAVAIRERDAALTEIETRMLEKWHKDLSELEAKIAERYAEIARLKTYPTATCHICSKRFRYDQLYDLDGNVPGGRKVTCAGCGFDLYDSRISQLKAEIAKLAEMARRYDEPAPPEESLGINLDEYPKY